MHMIRADSTEACKCMFDGVIREEGLRRVMQSGSHQHSLSVWTVLGPNGTSSDGPNGTSGGGLISGSYG